MSGETNLRVVPSRGSSGLLKISTLAASIAVVGGTIVILLIQGIGLQKGVAVFGPFALILLISSLFIFAVGFVLLFWAQTPRSVSLSSDGVKIVTPIKSHTIPWAEMMRVGGVGLGAVTIRRRSDPPDTVGGWFSISLEQARAILSDPRCPPVDLRDEWRQSILSEA